MSAEMLTQGRKDLLAAVSVGVVAQAKLDLQAAGVNLSGPCGAFAITNLAAQRLGLGVVDKPNGNNCRGRSIDGLMDRTGKFWDCLQNSGADDPAGERNADGPANVPVFNQGDPIEASRYRDPEVSTLPKPPAPPTTNGSKSLNDWLAMAVTIDRIYREELKRPLMLNDLQGEANWLFHWREEGHDDAWIRARIRESDEWKAAH